MGTKRIIIGAIILAIGIIAWLRMWYGENGLLPTLSNSTNTTQAFATATDPNTMLTFLVIAVIVAIGSVILASGIRSSHSPD